MKFLIDHNLRGHAIVLLGSLTASGWLDLISIKFTFFEEVDLDSASDDRLVDITVNIDDYRGTRRIFIP